MINTSSRLLEKHRFKLALLFTVLIHVIVLMAVRMTSSTNLGDLSLSQGQNEVEAVNITLVSRHKMTKGSSAQKTTIEDIANQMLNQADNEAQNLTPSTEALSQPQNNKSVKDTFGSDPFDQDERLAQEASKPNPNDAHTRLSNSNSQSLNDLWKAIEPCWRRNADKQSTTVTLEISFSPLGNLSKPPVIKRDPTKPLNEQSLRSEAKAITALTQCGPYLMAFGQQNVEVRFPGR